MMAEAATLAHECPGLGDPWNLTPAQWLAYLLRIYERQMRESGSKDAQMQVRLNDLLRQKRKQKAWLKHSEKQT